MKKTKVFKIEFDGSSCHVYERNDINTIIEHEIIDNEPLEVGDEIVITVTAVEMTETEIEDAGEFDGF